MTRTSYQTSQNTNNFLRDKPSQRCQQPPGGGSSIGSLIFGGGGGSNESPYKHYENRSSLRRKLDERSDPAHNERMESFSRVGKKELSSNQYASGNRQNAGNVLTERRITRIHAPPGGASSIVLG